MAANSAFHAGFLLISPPIRHNSTCIRCIIYIKHKGKVFLEDRMKRIICVLLVTVLIVSMLLSCSIPLRNSGEEKQRIVVQLDQDYWLASVGKMLKEHFPDVEFDFVISRGGAHFWVPRHENLRQLEFRIAVLWDKYTYLGENYCSEGEKHLVHLADVPALNFCSYCAAPEPYMVPHEMPKESFLQGLDVMEQLAKQAKDWLLVGWIHFYRRHPSTIVTRWVAHVLHHSIHFGFVKTLTETIKKETAIYPRRLFGKSGEERLALCLKKANARKEELEKTGAYVEIVRQEPFTIAKDQLDLKVYLLVSRQGMVNQKIQVEEIVL